MSDLAARARRHAATHPESRELIEELLGRIDAMHRTIRRSASGTWGDDLDTQETP